MARPNIGKTEKSNKYPRVPIHPNLKILLIAFKIHLLNDGHTELMDASMTDVSKLFVTHYLNETFGSSSMNKVKRRYEALITTKKI